MSEDAIQLAKNLLETDENYLENIIALSRIGNEMYGQCWDTNFHVFGLIASETDHLPLNHVRLNCSEEFLAKADKELVETIKFYRSDVVCACNKIIRNINV
ncbi:hypothetical protein WOC12_23320 [Vibrio parahaemolyticus]|uniref:hypothetical protein n=1 Tax=Vibrio parahaemolyticus TaxID=670 RepID=UPI00081BEEDA|nr:hypothetical protein [Vibrio parahaemolyticus]EIO4084094.1 hypothetical protein [Vibrio parahaemolyticus]EJC1449724.1 hypothetical protein [Vibrio parahaemolyticus]EJE4210446.1 hypothetical protein [Vibrio parahaemolyticus]MDF4613954.1 hypothetical protein [Vibrio parahaemolyticus]